jgi:hypothetical protein
MSDEQPRIERTAGWLLRWRVVYPTGGGMDLETLHITKVGARVAILMDRA